VAEIRIDIFADNVIYYAVDECCFLI